MASILLVSLLVAQATSSPPGPSPVLTPGSVLPVTAEQVCTPGYSRTVRDVPNAVKRAVLDRYGVTDTGGFQTTKAGRTLWRSDFEVDHLIPLELGGSNAVENLWPESYVSQRWNAHTKNRLENKLHRMVCAGDLTLADAQRAIAANWISAYTKYVGSERMENVTAEAVTQQEAVAAADNSRKEQPVPHAAANADVPANIDHNAARPTESAQRDASGKPAMGDFFVFAELPWLRRVLAYLLGLAVLWLFVSVVAFLLKPIVQRLRAAYRNFLGAVASRHRDAHRARKDDISQEIEELRHSAPLRRSLRRSGDTPLESDEVSGAFRPFVSSVQNAKEVLAEARASFDNLRDSLTQTSVTAVEFQTAIPSASDIRADHNTKMREAVHLVVGSLFLIAVMIVNTGMLSQILKDLEVVPATLKFGNVQLYYVFALLLTLVEAATGVLFGYLQQRVRRDAPASRLAPIFAILIALGFAFVEASFYSRVGAAPTAALAAEDSIHIPGIDTQIPFSTVMFCWGFSLVMLMLGSGTMIHNAMAELTQDAGLKSLRRRLTKASKASAAVGETMRVVEERQQALLAKTQKVVETFTTEFALNGSPELLVKLLTARLKTDAVPVPLTDDKLSHAEMKELELRTVFWWWTALIAVALCALSIQSFTSASDPRFAVGGAVVVFVLLAFGLGLDLSKQDIVAGITAHAERLGRRQMLRRVVRVIAVGVLAMLAGLVLLRPAAMARLLPWFTVTATAMVVVLAGRELAPWFAFVAIHLRKLLNAMLWLLGRVMSFTLAVGYAAVTLLDAIVELAAAPMSAVFGRTPESLG